MNFIECIQPLHQRASVQEEKDGYCNWGSTGGLQKEKTVSPSSNSKHWKWLFELGGPPRVIQWWRKDKYGRYTLAIMLQLLLKSGIRLWQRLPSQRLVTAGQSLQQPCQQYFSRCIFIPSRFAPFSKQFKWFLHHSSTMMNWSGEFAKWALSIQMIAYKGNPLAAQHQHCTLPSLSAH